MKWFSLKGFIIIPVLIASCRTTQVPSKAQFEDYRITTALSKDTSLIILTQPYRDSVDRSMNEVVGFADKTLDKKQPEGTLGNFMVDALYYGAKQHFGITPDAAVVNNGGIRLTQLPAGPVTRGKVFELMPFDNLVVIQKVKGDVLQQFLDLAAQSKGWPVHGIKMQIKDKKAVNVTVNGSPLDPNKTYTLVNSDYLANGGDNAIMLKAIPQQNIGYLMRDALFDYIKSLRAEGKNISANEQKRVENAQ